MTILYLGTRPCSNTLWHKHCNGSSFMILGLTKTILLTFLCFTLLAVNSFAAKSASSCFLNADQAGAEIKGTNIDERLPIGSVSKLVTSYWALSAMKATDRFSTRIFITPISTAKNGAITVDLHFEGSRDPYFGKENLHYLISELNKMKVTKIRNLTFDDDFKFFWNAGGGAMLSHPHQKVETGYYGPTSPTTDEVTRELKRYRYNMATGYGVTRTYLQKFHINLIPGARLVVQNIFHVDAATYHAPTGTQVRTISSSPLLGLLQEMNRNSNNNAANQIFEHLGGAEKFKVFIQSKGFTENDILFVNGHGNRKDLDNGDSFYNEATCGTVLKILAGLRKKLKSVGKDLDDLLPVPGVDHNSTLGAYNNSTYGDSVAAKSGTVGPAVTLAGLLLAKNGSVLFMYNMSTKGTQSDWRRARRTIAAQLITLTKQFNGGVNFDKEQVKFVAFDPELFFHEEDWKDDGDLTEQAVNAIPAKPSATPPPVIR